MDSGLKTLGIGHFYWQIYNVRSLLLSKFVIIEQTLAFN